MSTVGTITKLATEVVGKAAHAVTHPRQTVTTVTGHARGLAATVTRSEQRSQVSPDAASDQKTSKTSKTGRAKAEPEVVPSPPRTEPAEPVEPAEAVDPSTTEPKAASRQAAHQGRGTEPTDDWHDELDDGSEPEVNPATGQPHSTADDGPLLDPSVAKQVRSESETLSKAADPDK